MKLHSLVAGTTEDPARLQQLGKDLVSQAPVEPAAVLDEEALGEAKLKPTRGVLSRNPEMEEAILAITQDQPHLHKKIKHHD